MLNVVKLLSSFSFVISIAIILGIVVGGFPAYGNEISTISLIAAMTVSISNIPLSLKNYLKKTYFAVIINYVFLSTLILFLGYVFYDNIHVWEGFVVIAACPPAIAVVPLTKIIGGNEKLSLFALVTTYLLSIFLMPLLIYVFLSKMVSIASLLKNILLLILIPIILSRFIKMEKEKATIVANIFFFFIIFAIIGENRSFLLTDLKTLTILSILMVIRTFGSGAGIKFLTEKYGKKESISYSLFASFKNEGLAMILALQLFGSIAAIPATIATIFELMWAGFLEIKA